MSFETRDSYFFMFLSSMILLLTVLLFSKVLFHPNYSEENRLWRVEQTEKRQKYEEEQKRNKNALIGSKILHISPIDDDTVQIMTDKGYFTFEAEGYKGADLIPKYNLDNNP